MKHSLSPIYLDEKAANAAPKVISRRSRSGKKIVFGWYGGKFSHLEGRGAVKRYRSGPFAVRLHADLLAAIFGLGSGAGALDFDGAGVGLDFGPHQIDMKETVVERGALGLYTLGEDEAPLELVRGDAPV